MTSTLGLGNAVELVARGLCISAGHDPDACGLYGNQIVTTNWLQFVDQAQKVLARVKPLSAEVRERAIVDMANAISSCRWEASYEKAADALTTLQCNFIVSEKP